MDKWLTIVMIVLGVVLVVLIVLSLVGRKMQKKQEAAQANMMTGAQNYSIMVIDKKHIKLKEAGFPQMIIDQTPKWLRGRKIPVVKAKIGPKVMSLMCDEKIFAKVPVKKEVKALMNGIYIIDVKGLRGPLEIPQEKKGFFTKLREKAQKVVDEDKKLRNQKTTNKKGNTKASAEKNGKSTKDSKKK